MESINTIAVIGAGGFGKEVAMLIEQINAVAPQWEITGFFDDGKPAGESINGYKTLGGIAEVNRITSRTAAVIAIGDPKIKAAVFSKINNQHVFFPILIHPSALIGSTNYVKIGEGSVITANCVLTVNIEAGKFVILNLGCTVGHDTVIEDFVSVMPGVNISGEVVIREGAFIGTGTQVINRIEIGAKTIVGAGAVVTKSLPANCTAVGVPAKAIKFHK